MASIVKPQVLVFQEFSITPSEITDPMRAHISGPNAILHRYTDATEKATIRLGTYDPVSDTNYTWPGRHAGGVVDQAYTRLFIDDARLLYFQDLIGDESGGRGLNLPVAGRRNRIRNTSVVFKANGTDYPRSSILGDRDVTVGDLVYVRGVNSDFGGCDEYELWTYVTGFVADPVVSTVDDCRTDDNNAEGSLGTVSITQIAGPTNCVVATVDATEYDGLASGDVCETYQVEVIRSSIRGCNVARIRVRTASGNDDVSEADVNDMGEATVVGTRGLTVTFSVAGTDSCSSAAADDGVAPADLVVGQKWEIEVCQSFEAPCCEVSGDYAGDDDDVYIIEVTKGGKWEDLPEVTVTTVKGLDYSGPTTVSGANTAIPIGSNGLTMQFVDCGSAGLPHGDDDDIFGGLRKGDKFYVTVTSASDGPIRTLILRHDLPEELESATDLDLKLYIERDIEVSANRLSDPPLVNYEQETTQIVVKAGITAYDTSWTDGGVEQAMDVEAGTLYAHYREWVPDLADEVNFIADVADIDEIPGQLDEDNPLKWGVYKALQNSAASSVSSQSEGSRVGYTAVAEPDDLDSWQNVLERVDGREDLYNLVPLTFTKEVQFLYQAHVGAESTPEAGNWKAMFVALQAVTEKMIVGLSSTDAQALHPTSTDGKVVLAVIEDDPEATGTQYTKLRVPLANSGFITYGVQAGDIVRFLFTVDAWGEASYQEFVVDSVLSENSLLLLEGLDNSVGVPQKVEIWHRLNKNEIVSDLKEQAQAFADRRVCAVWPDLVGTAGNTQAGYFLCAALAGLVGSVAPHQPLTNVEVKGFDDYSRTYQFFSETQIDNLDDGGVWICTEDRDGTPHTRHALTTDTTDTNRQEEMIRRNVDSISYLFLRRLRPFIGRTNVTPSMLDRLRAEIGKTIDYLMSNGFTAELGSQLISGTIRSLYVHPLLADRVVVILDLVVPVPMNNIELHLVV